jgi:hypothetical protein
VIFLPHAWAYKNGGLGHILTDRTMSSAGSDPLLSRLLCSSLAVTLPLI